MVATCPTTEAALQTGLLPAQERRKGCFAKASGCIHFRPSEKSFRRPEICAKKACMISTQSKHENQAQDADGFVLIAIPIKPAALEMSAGQVLRFDKKRAHAAVAPQNIHIVAVAGGIELEQ